MHLRRLKREGVLEKALSDRLKECRNPGKR
jgi:hypothetical protein